MTTVYKVVRRRRDGKLASAVIRQGKLLVIYEPNKPSSALNGMKLLAFEGLRWAKAFATRLRDYPGHYRNLEVWEGTGVGVKPQNYISYWWAGWEAVREFWAAGGLDTRNPAPSGTVACGSITLIKRVGEAE